MLLSNGSESEERRERRVNMNIRFLGSKPADDFDETEVISSPSIFSEGMARVEGEGAGGCITTCPQETPNSMFVDRLEGMFGSGSVGRGSVAKPKAKVSELSCLSLTFSVLLSLPRETMISGWFRWTFAISLVVQSGGHSSAFITVYMATTRIGLAQCGRK